MTATTTRRGQQPRFPRIKELTIGADPRFDTRAGCRLNFAVLFDPRREGESAEKYEHRLACARRACGQCPVMQTCLEFGTANRCSGFMGGQLLVDGKPERLPRRGSRS